MMSNSATIYPIRWKAVWFGLLGGAVAWTVQLLAASLLSEWGYLAGLSNQQWQGVSAVTWLILLVTVVTLLISVVAVVFAAKARNHLRWNVPAEAEGRDNAWFMANLALMTSITFSVIIVAQAVPLLFLWRAY